MAEIIKMPRLSDTMEEGVVATWLKNVGDQVKEGEILAEIETDKATMEFESFYDGTLLHIAIEEGVPATVDSLLCIIGDEGEDISKYINNSSLETTEKNEIENTTSNQLDLVDQINEQEKIDDSDNSKIENVEISITEKTNQIEGSIDYITMPRLSDTMEEGTISSWLKKVGDKVQEGEILAEIETDKATMEFESFYDGTLLHIAIEEGVPATVDSLLCIIGDEGEDISKYINNSSLETTEKNEIENTTSNQLDLVDQINEQEKIDDSDNSKIENVEISITEKTNQIEGSIDYITMPRLSDTMEEGTISSWLKKVGDKVQEGEILAEIETDKATMEFESFYDGILSHIAVNEGETVKVDELIAIISENEIDVSKALETYGKESSNISVEESNDSVELNEVDKEINSTNTSSDLNERIKASPLAKKIAKEKNIDLSKVTGTGENGRIIKNDLSDLSPVEETTEQQIQTEENQSPKVVDVIKEETTIVQNSTMRKAIAKNLSKSKFTAPHYYLSVEFNMDNAIAFREQYNSIPDTKISFNDIVVKACAVALKNHPQVNSQWNDDKIILNNNVHIGVAVGIEDGLVVPVIKNADKESLHSINSKVRDYAVRAKSKKLRPDEIEGSTFTISNLGMFGITEFTSIINQPNSAILSVGAIVKKPVVVNDKIVVSNTMKLTLACDHRSVDGVTGSLFLQTLKGYIENPVTILV